MASPLDALANQQFQLAANLPKQAAQAQQATQGPPGMVNIPGYGWVYPDLVASSPMASAENKAAVAPYTQPTGPVAAPSYDAMRATLLPTGPAPSIAANPNLQSNLNTVDQWTQLHDLYNKALNYTYNPGALEAYNKAISPGGQFYGLAGAPTLTSANAGGASLGAPAPAAGGGTGGAGQVFSPAVPGGGGSTAAASGGGTFFSPTGGGGAAPTTGNSYAGGVPFGQSSPSSSINAPDIALAMYGSPGYAQSLAAMGSPYLMQSAATGNPINQLPAWQSMVDAQQRQLQENFGNLNEAFGASGNRFSTSYGQAATDYWNQANLQQNALLGQMQTTALENAANRALSAQGQQGQIQLGAANPLAQMGFQGISQLSSQDFQSQMQQYNAALQAAMLMAQSGAGAAGQLASQGYGASTQLLNNAMAGTQGLFNTENTAAGAMYGGEMSGLNSYAQQMLALQQLGLSGASALSSAWNTNLQTGGQLGGEQYTQQQQAINTAYQEWLRTQPAYNPLLSYLFQASTSYPQMQYPSYQPGMFASLFGAGANLFGQMFPYLP